jgi:protein TonB
MKDLKAPLETKRPLLFLVGLVVALSVTLVSFEWRTPYELPAIAKDPGYIGEDPIWIPVTLPEPVMKLEKPALPNLKPETIRIEISESTNPEPVQESPKFPEIVELAVGTLESIVEVEVEDPNKIWDFPAVRPVYCGGETAMLEFLHKELKYPEIPRVNGVSGTVQVQFVVGKDGKVHDAKVIRPVDPWLDAEALRVAKMLDCFTAGRQAGRDVDVYFVLPVKFKLG